MTRIYQMRYWDGEAATADHVAMSIARMLHAWTLATLAIALYGCESRTIHYQASRSPSSPPSEFHGAGATLALPARGTVRADVLGNGWPVWVVHDEDGSVTVVSAVRVDTAQSTGTAPNAAPSATVVNWLEGARRFVAGRYVYDEHGRALGYRGYALCLGECTRLEDLPRLVTDLDTFAVATDRTTGRAEVQNLRRGARRRAARSWIAVPDAREPALPWPQRSVDDARAMDDGSYAIVTGQLVLSTAREPALCGDPSAGATCAACGTTRLPLRGIPGEPAATLHARMWWRDPREYARIAAGPHLEARRASYLVRRDGAAFSLVAVATFQGVCSTGP